MRNIKELIKERAKRDDVQIKIAKPIPPNLIAWEETKKHVDNLPVDYERVFHEMLEKSPDRIDSKQSVNGTSIEITLKPHNGHTIVLDIAEHEEEGIVYVAYIAFDSNIAHSTAYIREVYKKVPEFKKKYKS